jgi:hypothetical protein
LFKVVLGLIHMQIRREKNGSSPHPIIAGCSRLEDVAGARSEIGSLAWTHLLKEITLSQRFSTLAAQKAHLGTLEMPRSS